MISNPGVPQQLLPPDVEARVAVEQASTLGWHRYVGHTHRHRHGHLRHFRAAQGPLTKFGFTTENIVAKARAQLGLDHAVPEGTTLDVPVD